MSRPQPFRLDAGGLIDRGKPIEFAFNGKRFIGFEGDSLASALLANGVKVVARSFKYHRPRGIFTAGEEEPCALLELGRGSTRVPSCRAPAVQLKPGLSARSQKGWPGLGFDLGRVVDFSHALWPAGFYNKTFKWPGWHAWESFIRNSAGLGRVPNGPDPDHYERMNWHCDLLICGGGLAGLMAALIAGRSGLRVLVAEVDWAFGGAALQERLELDGKPATEWVATTLAELRAMPNVLMLTGTTVTGIYDHKVATLAQAGDGKGWRECYWQVRPKQVLIATGAIEQGLIFPNNDRPGIMLASAVRAYLNRFAVVPGKRVAIACNNDNAYQSAIDLAHAGAQVVAVIDERAGAPASLAERMSALGITHLAGARIVNTRGTMGIRGVQVEAQGGVQWLNCDLLAVSGGWAPRVHLLSHAGGRLRYDSGPHCFRPGEMPAGLQVIGSANGPFNLDETFSQARNAVSNACGALGMEVATVAAPRVGNEPIVATETGWHAPRQSGTRQWIDLAHDVTTQDAELAVREGFESVEHFKRYTTAGMSVDQGKTSNTNTFLLLSHLANRDPESTGTTTFRPPYSPVTAGVMAAQATGDLYAPHRYMPAHSVHLALGAHMEDFGWQRPEYYSRKGESAAQAISREVLAVRNGAGVFDNSPIGKLAVCGPDAAEFLDRLYINNLHNLQPGSARYGLMLNENGIIIDDGVVISLTPEHFIVHTTSANAQRVAEMMEEWLQCEWTNLKVIVQNETSQWANFAIAGPQSQAVLEALGGEFETRPGALSHMGATTGSIGSVAARLSRVSYSGEKSFEINVPAAYGASLLKAILKTGEHYSITPIGIEALMVLRTEKGYLHVGSDTDGSTTPDDVGWGAVARRKDRDFIGRRSLFRSANEADGRKQLVGLAPLDKDTPIPAGGHLLLDANGTAPARTDGWVTSACYSPTLEHHIALAMLSDGRSHHGRAIRVYDQGRYLGVKVVPPAFYDPDNERLA